VLRLFTGRLADRPRRTLAARRDRLRPHAACVPLLAVSGGLTAAALSYNGERVGKAVRTPAGLDARPRLSRWRRPQCDGFLLIMIGFLLRWPTIPTLLMFRVLVLVYRRPARSEERDAPEGLR
jgi:hypothetical protein